MLTPVNPRGMAALNASIRAAEGQDLASRAAQAGLERIILARETSGLADYEVFQALARGSSRQKDGFHYLCRLVGVLVEFLTSWGALALIGVSLLSMLVVLKQGAARIWNAITGFVKNNPLTSIGLGLGLGAGAAYLLRRDDNPASESAAKAAVDVLSTSVAAALPAPIVALASTIQGLSVEPVNVNVPPAPTNSRPEPTQQASAGGFLRSNIADAYDAYDAYDSSEPESNNNYGDAYDAYDSDGDAGNIGN